MLLSNQYTLRLIWMTLRLPKPLPTAAYFINTIDINRDTYSELFGKGFIVDFISSSLRRNPLWKLNIPFYSTPLFFFLLWASVTLHPHAPTCLSSPSTSNYLYTPCRARWPVKRTPTAPYNISFVHNKSYLDIHVFTCGKSAKKILISECW